MPGRRYPRRSQGESQSSHVRSAFPGGLDGASLIPAPVGGEGWQSGARGGCPEVLFYNDEFPAAGGAQTVVLTYLPISYSEHVYLCRGGGGGLYQREELTWVRDAGSRTITVLVGMDARPGDVIVVEYAYYEQAAAPTGDQIWWQLGSTGSGSETNMGTLGPPGDGSIYGGPTIAAPLVAGSTGSLVMGGGSLIVATAGGPAVLGMEYHTSFAVVLPDTETRTLAQIGFADVSIYGWLLIVEQLDTGVIRISTGSGPTTAEVSSGAPGETVVVNASVRLEPCWTTDPGVPVTAVLSLDVNGATSSVSTAVAMTEIIGPQSLFIAEAMNYGVEPLTMDEVRFGWSGSYVAC